MGSLPLTHSIAIKVGLNFNQPATGGGMERWREGGRGMELMRGRDRGRDGTRDGRKDGEMKGSVQGDKGEGNEKFMKEKQMKIFYIQAYNRRER